MHSSKALDVFLEPLIQFIQPFVQTICTSSEEHPLPIFKQTGQVYTPEQHQRMAVLFFLTELLQALLHTTLTTGSQYFTQSTTVVNLILQTKVMVIDLLMFEKQLPKVSEWEDNAKNPECKRGRDWRFHQIAL
jgi:hypothetical protein